MLGKAAELSGTISPGGRISLLDAVALRVRPSRAGFLPSLPLSGASPNKAPIHRPPVKAYIHLQWHDSSGFVPPSALRRFILMLGRIR